MNTKVINLLEYRGGSRSTIFTGRDTGEKVRKDLNLDKVDREGGSLIEFVIPPGTTSINPSFFLGLFYDSYRYLGGRDQFEKKYRLKIAEEDEDIVAALNENIEDGFNEAKVSLIGKRGLDYFIKK